MAHITLPGGISGIALPLFGASLLVVLALDRFVIRRVPAVRRFSHAAVPFPREEFP